MSERSLTLDQYLRRILTAKVYDVAHETPLDVAPLLSSRLGCTVLLKREDDQPDKIKRRLDTYHRETEPLIDYYEQRGLLRRFDGSRSPTEVHDHIRATLATLRLEERL